MSVLQLVLRRPIAELRLVNPDKLNALTVDMLAQLMEHCDMIDRFADVRAVILTAEGNGGVCTWAEITAWSDMPLSDYVRHWVRDGHRILDRLARQSKPTIAAITGMPLAAGWNSRRPATSASCTPMRCWRCPSTGLAWCRAGRSRNVCRGCCPRRCRRTWHCSGAS